MDMVMGVARPVSYVLSNGKGADHSMRVIENIVNSAKILICSDFSTVCSIYIVDINHTRIKMVLLFVRGRII